MTRYVPSFLRLRVFDAEQIILRARQNHLFESFRDQTVSLTPDLLAKVQDAWQSHVLDKVSKGLPESIKLTTEDLRTLWPKIEALRDDKVGKAECLKRDEKFEMNLRAAVGLVPLLAITNHSNTHHRFVPLLHSRPLVKAKKIGNPR